jgi:hypothetical protein
LPIFPLASVAIRQKTKDAKDANILKVSVVPILKNGHRFFKIISVEQA